MLERSCHICEGRETVESVVRLQLIAEQTPDKPRPFIPLCKGHCTEAEGARARSSGFRPDP